MQVFTFKVFRPIIFSKGLPVGLYRIQGKSLSGLDTN